MNRLVGIVLALILTASIASSADAAVIQGATYIRATTNIATCGAICGGVGANINQIADGDISNFNGFAGQDGVVGTIRLDLLGDFDLESFMLWNDINVLREGVGSFRLHFFDAADSLIETSSTFTAPISQFAAGTYTFGSVIHNVSRVDLEVLTLLTGGVCCRIEIREVAFNGDVSAPVTAVPEGSLFLISAACMAACIVIRRRREKSRNAL